MKILLSKELKPYNSFSINQNAELILQADSVQDLIDIWSDDKYSDMIKLPLGAGSNTLFCNAFNGVVVLNRIYGRSVIETEGDYFLKVSSGEDWPNLVEWCVDNGFPGIENLAMIPGCAGTAPIQNIGAYGLELKDVCESVEYLDLDSLQIKTLQNADCHFGYRESIFKHELKDKCIITAITLRLAKKWTPLLSYGPLSALRDKTTTTTRDVFNQVCEIRCQKLPDPKVLGNAGSFFKNPIISSKQYCSLLQSYPNLPAYDVEDGKKIPAGWLIDNAGLKGFKINDAQVHKEQALVLINNGQATSDDILKLAHHVKLTVLNMYNIELEHEVRFYADGKESFLSELFHERSH
ncbi:MULTISPECIES: UDP-N-acetylmuramate dehydrogenase [Aliivibrio]|uniref:UDP-N-acetylenolpyruvoylglucosamine reductase n=1 Tax=Aliivibrio finisterrensis TaxID=511998 RepID=A0A4Q5KLZ8_9GAMM|nr:MULTISPECIES: UDP-N-acetylmuramate dehydrogenase [Aliivibrio]MDD9180696.1 UDP-N-acetylmuramate dehydrogenase [Aliivibrio sp. A6]RYU47430.1 UDP-N-acetylmuramate dehydrogenase [Aliivibrio finisterrensis]RYU48284.1 UDP-N-acetylmuramate dehydrogenase [Aliivibrio finisterrensis]RYU52950.1 UDP-N-acetylmuramate dehydrogenase [Aliivibrio finisterrensis]RYU59578.1 UDP-N-acetylmuramate dehydrogenase [Aliivibrio finisterrensis]